MITEYKFNITITLEDGDESTQDEIKDIVEDYLELGCNNESIGGNSYETAQCTPYEGNEHLAFTSDPF